MGMLAVLMPATRSKESLGGARRNALWRTTQ